MRCLIKLPRETSQFLQSVEFAAKLLEEKKPNVLLVSSTKIHCKERLICLKENASVTILMWE